LNIFLNFLEKVEAGI